MRFNGPRSSRHTISVRSFLPLNKISAKIEGITVFNPLPPRRFDLVHAFNRIPIGTTPFIVGFESHLPRAYGLESTGYFRILSGMLAGERCRAIVAISEYARRQFMRQHTGRPWYESLIAKLHVRYPNFPIPPGLDAFVAKDGDPVRLVFVGNHFGRKGGSVAVRLAELAQQRKFPLEVDIVSSIEVGSASWTDPTRPEYWERDLGLLKSLPSVRHHGSLPNSRVLALVKKAHFAMLPTLSDSFGYSVIEAMANYTPVIATHQGALPEFIQDGVNGILLPLETDAYGEWKHIGRADRGSAAYEEVFDSAVNRLVNEAYTKLETLMQSPATYRPMRLAARATAEALFSAEKACHFWDEFYCKVMPK